MRLEYENKFRDVIEFQTAHQLYSPALQLTLLAFAFLIFWLTSTHSSLTYSITFALLSYAAMLTTQFIFNIIYFASRKNHAVLTTHTIEVTDTAFIEETKYNKSYFYWNGINKAVSRFGNVAIYTTPHTALIVPRRAFSSHSQRQDLIKLINARVDA
ncbi:YcxB family protein [Pseudomonas sp. F(2018)]|uniref:YcxB family protein n=1 Tax=Pseudomonas sp. F(2018) TaxID=2502240 RepID=UPI0010F6837A|nr:YcxB family protein [Pseudomonas sp. F(2018)]